mmetsp:Transcript_24645/g.28332  ORF Transcript_24645/g.28332 Transcript_24645/m.28332 type:complete len:87 (-) Transcript_24645:84-344(-)
MFLPNLSTNRSHLSTNLFLNHVAEKLEAAEKSCIEDGVLSLKKGSHFGTKDRNQHICHTCTLLVVVFKKLKAVNQQLGNKLVTIRI